MPVVPVIVKAFAALCNGEVVIVTPCCPNIKKVRSSFASPNAFAVNAFHFLVVVFVSHNEGVFGFDYFVSQI